MFKVKHQNPKCSQH